MTSAVLVNLLPGEIVARRARSRVMRTWVAVLCLGAGAVVAGMIVTRAPKVIGGVSSERKLDALDAEIASIEGEIPALDQQLGVMGKRLAMLDTLEDRPDWGLLLRYIYEALGEGAILSRFELSWSGAGAMTIEIHGVCEKPGQERSLVLGLERSGLFDETTLVETRREVVGGVERIKFEIRARFDPERQGGVSP